ncbi:unnamed protein product [Bursaphelenchus okinawaensis]|uniref:Uncharacterized protein n=1 Tax=Bursaphelenchus okinawaensis TaxID=465554 RepID=A0A811KKA2_9BILA|nr:unnamed protein product [Bursaphelenchus okinawaensis]CAG9105468.1 unnamed protein product [Bursaphelenchus okinawaensis]
MTSNSDAGYSLRKRTRILYVDQAPSTSNDQNESLEYIRMSKEAPVNLDLIDLDVHNGVLIKRSRRSFESKLASSRFDDSNSYRTKNLYKLNNYNSPESDDGTPKKKRTIQNKEDSDYDVDVDYFESEDESNESDIEVASNAHEALESSLDSPYYNTPEVEQVRKELRQIFEYSTFTRDYYVPEKKKKCYVYFYMLSNMEQSILKRYEDSDSPSMVILGIDKTDDKNETVLCSLLFCNEEDNVNERQFLVLAGWRGKDDYGSINTVLSCVWKVLKDLNLDLRLLWKYRYIANNYGYINDKVCVFCNEKCKGEEENTDRKKILDIPLDKVYVRLFDQKLEIVNKLIRLMEKFLVHDSNTELYYKIIGKKKLYMSRSKLNYKFRKNHSYSALDLLSMAERLSEVRSTAPEVENIGKMLLLFKRLIKGTFERKKNQEIHVNVVTSSKPCVRCEKMIEYMEEFGRNEMDTYIHLLCHHSAEISRMNQGFSVSYENKIEKLHKDFAVAKTKQCCRDGTKKDAMAARYLAVNTFLPEYVKKNDADNSNAAIPELTKADDSPNKSSGSKNETSAEYIDVIDHEENVST